MSEKLSPGTILGGDFEIVRMLGHGGMGAVYEARQKSTGALRAVKTMRADIVESESAKSRFMQEARVAATIESEHVVTVLSAGIDDALGIPFIAMELLKGEDLAAMLARGPLDFETAREIFAQIGHAVAAAHRAGIVHRDLKPANVFVSPGKSATRTLTVKMLDFGIAKVLGASQATQTGAVGTPLWMAPEQTTRGADISPRTDVWALGLIAFYALTGKMYWLAATGSDSVMELLREITIEPLATASDRARALGSSVPEGFDPFFERCVTREPSDRWADAAEAVASLDALLAAAIARGDKANVAPALSPYAKTTALEDMAPIAKSESKAKSKELSTAKTDAAVASTRPEVLAAPPKSRVWIPIGIGAAIVLGLLATKPWASAPPTNAPPTSGSPVPSAAASAIPTASTSAVASASITPRAVPMARFSGAYFMMGNANGAADEKPPTRMSLAGFEIDRTEVTAADYESCVSAGACTAARKDANCNYSREGRGTHPINCVTYADASAFCKWAGKRLPSEYEWEHAARGAKNTIYPWGDEAPSDDRLCWRRGKAEGNAGGTCAVKSFAKSDSDNGVSDMAGNVWEWTSGRYCSYTTTSCTDDRRVLRGGGWASENAPSVSATVRQDSFEDNQSPSIGFRCARSL